jgi:aspartyl-tRNA(Asn)/glutamyl-tRNA(Gln) amidotransferase subunit A
MSDDVSQRSFLKPAVAGTTASLLIESRPASQGGSGTLTALTLREASELVRQRKVSPVELTQACLARIDQLNPTLNAFIIAERHLTATECATMRDTTAESARSRTSPTRSG